MRIPDRFNPVLKAGRFFKLGEFGQKQLERALIHSVLWFLLLRAVDWHKPETYLSLLYCAWLSWRDLVRFWCIPSTYDPRCRKRKYESEMVVVKTAFAERRMCSMCYEEYKSFLGSLERAGKALDVLKTNIARSCRQ